MQHPAWILIGLGCVLVTLGLFWMAAPSIPWLGRLPGDIGWQRGNVRVYFPIVTCLVLSALLTGLTWLVRFLTSSGSR